VQHQLYAVCLFEALFVVNSARHTPIRLAAVVQ
jgi:hypothetical protein